MSRQEDLIASRMMNRFAPKVKIEQRITPIYKKKTIKKIKKIIKPTRRVTFKGIKEPDNEQQIASRMMNYNYDEPKFDEPEIGESDPERPGYYTILNNLQIVKKEEKEAKKERILAYKEREEHDSKILDEYTRILELRDQPDKFRSRMNSLLEKIETLEEKERIAYETRRVSDLERTERKKLFLDQYTLFTGEVVETYPDEEYYPKKSDLFRDNVRTVLSRMERTLI